MSPAQTGRSAHPDRTSAGPCRRLDRGGSGRPQRSDLPRFHAVGSFCRASRSCGGSGRPQRSEPPRLHAGRHLSVARAPFMRRIRSSQRSEPPRLHAGRHLSVARAAHAEDPVVPSDPNLRGSTPVGIFLSRGPFMRRIRSSPAIRSSAAGRRSASFCRASRSCGGSGRPRRPGVPRLDAGRHLSVARAAHAEDPVVPGDREFRGSTPVGIFLSREPLMRRIRSSPAIRTSAVPRRPSPGRTTAWIGSCSMPIPARAQPGRVPGVVATVAWRPAHHVPAVDDRGSSDPAWPRRSRPAGPDPMTARSKLSMCVALIDGGPGRSADIRFRVWPRCAREMQALRRPCQLSRTRSRRRCHHGAVEHTDSRGPGRPGPRRCRAAGRPRGRRVGGRPCAPVRCTCR